MSPDLGLEEAFGGVACGVDEVGRGCLAGRVTAAAVIVPAGAYDVLARVRDSKVLSSAARDSLAPVILGLCQVGIGHASVEEIERLNILQATFLAMRRAVAALPVVPGLALVDGNRVPPGLPMPARAIVGGDARSLSIAAASIVAKVDRDRHMADLDALSPGYGWAVNAGYGTPAHLEALARLGASEHHRRTFAPVRNLVAPTTQGAFSF